MNGDERRLDMLKTIAAAAVPISGASLAEKYNVSRQVIVHDISLLRAANYEIYATPKGYVLLQSAGELPQHQDNAAKISTPTKECFIRQYKVSHTDEQIEDELNTIVDMGGRVTDVLIKHRVYGTIRADLPICCRRQVQEFMEQLSNGKSKPLKNLSSGNIHYHNVEADSEEVLDLIETALKSKGYLM